VSRYVYFYLFRFLSCAPRKQDAAVWAAAFVAAFFVGNVMALCFTVEILMNAHIKVSHGEAIIGVIGGCSAAWSFTFYEVMGKGKEVIASLNGTRFDRHSAVIGALVFFEALLSGGLPGIIVVLRNPTP
jgi:hypothetical protein